MPTCKLSPLFSSVRSNKRPYKSSCLQTLLKSGFTPTAEHLNLHLLFLDHSHRFNSIVHFFNQMERNGVEWNSRTCSFFMRALLKLHKFEEAEQFMMTHVAKFAPFPQNGIWDSLIQGYCLHHKDPEKALSVLRDCLSRYDTVPSSYTVCSLIHSFSSRGMMERAIEVLELLTGAKIKYPFCNFVCSSVISGFVRIGKPELAVEFFEKAKSSGTLSPNIVIYTSLVHALCNLGRVDEVSDLVRLMEEERLAFDVVFYSCWICGFLEEGLLTEGFRKNRHMLEKAIRADVVSYTALMNGFSREVNAEKAVGFLAKMKRDGLEPNLVTYTAIILGLCRKGKLEEAFTAFRMIGEMGIRVDEFLYATLIEGACRKGDFSRVLHLLSDMEKKGISPGVVTYNTVINGLCKFGRTTEADEFSKKVPRDIITYSTLLHGYIMEENVEGVLETCRRFEEAGLSMDVVMCNVLIKASFMVGRLEDARALYKRMPSINVTANSFTYCTLIDGYCKVGRIVEALEIFDEFKKASISSVVCYNCIISGLCRKGIADMAADVFLELNQKDFPTDRGICMMLIKTAFKNQSAEGVLQLVIRIGKLPPGIYDDVCNEALCFLCEKGFPDSAMEIYLLMRSNGSIITSKSYFSVIKGLMDGNKHIIQPFLCLFMKMYGVADPKVGRSLSHYLCYKDVNIALRFVYKMKEKNFSITLPRSIFKTLLTDGRALDAYKLLMDAYDVVPNMDVVDHTIIVDGLCKGGYLDQALNLCSSLLKKGIALNIVSYNSIINALGRQGRLIEAFRLYDSLERVGLVPSEITYGTLIDTLCREQLLPEAESFLKKMIVNGHKPSIHAYNSFIDSYAKNDKLDEALKVLHEVEMKGLSVDEFTVSALINGFCRRGDLEGALNSFSNFKDKGILPDLLGFLYLIRGLSAKGRMEEARGILREMLQCQPIVELIDKVESEVGTESLHGFLVLLCDQGNVKAAITVLDEIGSMYHPVHRFHSFHESIKTSKGHEEDTFHTDDLRSSMPFAWSGPSIGSSEVQNTEISYDEERPKFCEFDDFYSQITVLCSRGELEKANLLLKEIIC